MIFYFFYHTVTDVHTVHLQFFPCAKCTFRTLFLSPKNRAQICIMQNIPYAKQTVSKFCLPHAVHFVSVYSVYAKNVEHQLMLTKLQKPF